MPDWKNLLGIDKKHEKKPNKDTFDNITHENTPPPKKTNNNNEGGNLVTVVKTITTTDANGNKTTKTITYTTTEPVDSFEPETITFEHPPLEDGVSIENLLDQELKHHPHNEDDKENILPVVETHPKHHNHEEKSKISQIVTKDFVEHYNAAEHDYSKVDHHARTTPSSKTKDVPTLSHHLTSPFKETDEKLRAIFTWIAENIVYDVDALFSGNIHHMDATQVLHKRLAVCDGYSELYMALAKEANLEVWKISGRAKGVGYVPGADIESRQFGHAWNAVCLRGEYLLIESTWGAGIVQGTKFVKRYDPFYFLTVPTKLIYSHLPRKDEEQYLSPPITVQEFLSLPFVKPPFYTAGLSFTKRMGTEIEVNDSRLELEIERTRPDANKPLHAYLEWDHRQVPVFIQRLSGHGKRGGQLYRIISEIPSHGEGKLNIFVLLDGTEGPLASQFKVRNHGKGIIHGSHTDSPFVTIFSVPLSFTILTPIHHTLKYNSKQRFEFVIFDHDEETLPEFCLFTPGKDTITIPKVLRNLSDGSVTYALETTLNEKGKWSLTFLKDEETLDFMAQYSVE